MHFGSKSGCGATLARLTSRLSRPYVLTFQTQTLGTTMQFGSKSGCNATLRATHVQTFQILCPDFPDSNSRRFLDFPDLISRLSRLKLSARPSPRWSGKSRPLRLHLKSRAVSTSVWKVAPSPHCSGKSRHMHRGLGCLQSD